MDQELVFATVDVFSDSAFGGNPLAVYPYAEKLTSEQMQQIAQEMNYSETTFVLPPRDPQHTADVRIFTPQAELPFAGHPNVGTAWVLAQHPQWVPGQAQDGQMCFEQRAGLVQVEFQYQSSQQPSACWITAPKLFERLHVVPRQVLADCVGIEVDAICNDGCVASVGIPFAFVEVSDREVLARCKPQLAAFELADASHGYPGEGFSLMVYCRSDSAVLHARMFGPLIGISEDPATGSAAAALAALLAGSESKEFVLHQGADMGRPSVLQLRVQQREGGSPKVQVGGRCVPMINGVLRLDN
ncbi:MAG: PhzF family phenazine biosynthesis protein [Pseudomonadales bacterium]